MGKSTFGNFLLDPDNKHMYEYPTLIAAATDNRPMTQEVKVVRKKVQIGDGRSEMLTIIDTPGLNKSADKDLSHMIGIIKTLNEYKKITACILVVKFNAKIDAQYRATLEYYSKLLPGLFDNNVIIVMTDYATDEHSEIMRKRQHINVEQVKRNTILELEKCSNQQIKQLFAIDCLPLNDHEIHTSLAVRTTILEYIIQLLPIEVMNQMVAKTDYIKQKDIEKYKELQGEIIGYKEGLKEVHKDSEKLLDYTLNKEVEIIEAERKIKHFEAILCEKDATEDVVAARWSINEEGRMFRSFTRNFNIKSPYEITKYTMWTNGKCEFKDIVKTSHTISGRVEGRFMRGLYASITVYTKKRIKYADEIAELKRNIAEKEKNITQCKADSKNFKELHRERFKEIELLQQFINERRIEVKKCLSDLMTMEEAMARLDEL
uniref:Uncharacterized protein n=1 Tax=Amphimedon queenslandica TaxID=400682 RepID=A0A1X7TQK2_AMPQE